MQSYIVGGAVRDQLLGRPSNDRDWVVVGATPEDMARAGFMAVGRDFPVFLHPETREEYALARTERKTAPGYRGFVVHADPSVTLEEDLARRDLTINAMALSPDGQLIDPFGGARDLQQRILRHVSDAFVEDPVRILRLARFAARLPDFRVADETMALMRRMVQAGEVDALVAERVWQELSRGLMEGRPSRMFEVLQACGALAVVLPEVQPGEPLMRVLDIAAGREAPLEARFACLCHDLGEGKLLAQVCERWRVPVACREVAEVVAREHGNVHRSGELGAAAVVQLLERCDALRRPQRFEQVLLACECVARGQRGFEDQDRPYPVALRLLQALRCAQAIDAAAVARAAGARGLGGPQVGEAVRQARIAAVAEGLALRG